MTTLIVMVVGLLLLASGWAAGHGELKWIFPAFALAGLGVLAVMQRAAFVAVMVLVAANAFPFVYASDVVARGARIQDLAIAALITGAAAWAVVDSTGDHSLGRPARRLVGAGQWLLAWWAFTFVRTVFMGDASVSLAAGFGRDFLYFALLLQLLPRMHLSRREIEVLIGILGAGACAFAIGQIAIATGMGAPWWLVHAGLTVQSAGLTRVYAQATDLVVVVLTASLGGTLAGSGTRRRLVAPAVTLLLGASILLELGRSLWVGVGTGLLSVTLWLLIRDRGELRARLGKRLPIAVATLVVATILVLLAGADSLLHGGVAQRIGSTFSQLQTGTGTVSYRTQVFDTLAGLLGANWPIGLGFIPSTAHYYLSLPGGSIRNPDVGVMNALMTMGAIGTALIYWPLISTLRETMRRQAGETREFAWLRYGGSIWIVGTIVSSVTLITLFSPSGLTITAVLLAIMCHQSVTRPDEAPAENDSGQRMPPHTPLVQPGRTDAFSPTGLPSRRRSSPRTLG